ncbi:hypothetical protein [Piscinibacter koreensis]|uniref:TubC N-terminal docking domain-containing protein n=1 Tax=Piscinibacter koreensis TaxID=2742824 RepID=A0A7Y6NP29_9BURK|nr:hypothetical protein [Schlegelella koreensis]NUZ06745.1 hypothetical protein [Schlegelella koreensis]
MGASDLLQALRGDGFRLSVALDGRLNVAPAKNLTEHHRGEIREQRNELLALLRQEQPLPTPWSADEIQTFSATHARLRGLGMSEDQAEELAERLIQRDCEQDDRRSCAECRHLQRGNCSNWRAAGYPEPANALVRILQRCPGFASRGAV